MEKEEIKIKESNEIFYLSKKIGSGSFGQIYLGSNDLGRDLAIKMEPVDTRHP